METQEMISGALAAAALRRIARDESIKAYVQQDLSIQGVLLRAARRFVGGETLNECLEVAAGVNEAGSAVTID